MSEITKFLGYTSEEARRKPSRKVVENCIALYADLKQKEKGYGMRYVMTVSPDFSPDKIAGWYIFNTWLQRQLDIHIHLELYSDFNSQRESL